MEEQGGAKTFDQVCQKTEDQIRDLIVEQLSQVGGDRLKYTDFLTIVNLAVDMHTLCHKYDLQPTIGLTIRGDRDNPDAVPTLMAIDFTLIPGAFIQEQAEAVHALATEILDQMESNNGTPEARN